MAGHVIQEDEDTADMTFSSRRFALRMYGKRIARAIWRYAGVRVQTA